MHHVLGPRYLDLTQSPLLKSWVLVSNEGTSCQHRMHVCGQWGAWGAWGGGRHGDPPSRAPWRGSRIRPMFQDSCTIYRNKLVETLEYKAGRGLSLYRPRASPKFIYVKSRPGQTYLGGCLYRVLEPRRMT